MSVSPEQSGMAEQGVVEYDPSAATFELLLDQDPHPALRPHLERLAAQNDLRESVSGSGDTGNVPSTPEVSPEHHQRHVAEVAAIIPSSERMSSNEVDALGAVLEVGDEAIGRQIDKGFFGRMADRWRRRRAGSAVLAAETDTGSVDDTAEAEPPAPQTPYERLEATYRVTSLHAEGQQGIGATERLAVMRETLDSLVAEGAVMGASEKRAIVNMVGEMAGHVQQELLANPLASGEDVARANGALLALLECHDKIAPLRFATTAREELEDLDIGRDEIDEMLDGDGRTEVREISDNLLVYAVADRLAKPPIPQHETVDRLRELAEASQRYGLRNVPVELAASLPANSNPIHRIAAPIYGNNAIHWGERQDLPPRLRQLADGENFARTALEYMTASVPGESRREAFARRDEVAELVLTEELRFSRPLADALVTSLAGRNGGGLDAARKLYGVLERGRNTERCEKLFQTFDIVNFDRYTEEQLDTMYRLAEGDQSLIEELQAKKTTLLVTDALYDSKRVFDVVAEKTAAVYGKDVLVAEALKPDTFDKLRDAFDKMGIQPSALVAAGHGQPGAMSMGKGEIGGFGLPVEDTALVRFINGSMQPDVNGEVNVLFISCSLAQAEDQYSTSVIHKVTDATGAVGWGMPAATLPEVVPIGRNRNRIGFGNKAQRFEKTAEGVRQTGHTYVEFHPNERKAA